MNRLKPVRPAGVEEPFDVLLLLVACIVIGVLAGALAHAIGTFIWLIVIFPLAMGFAVGMGAGMVIQARKVRAPLIAVLCAGLGGFAAWSMDLGIGYVTTRSNVSADLRDYATSLEADTGVAATEQAISEATDFLIYAWGEGRQDEELNGQLAAILIAAPITVDDLEEQEPPEPVGGLAAAQGFVKFRLSLGTSIGNPGSEGSPIGATGTLILWIVEMVFATGLAGIMARESAMQPSCTNCKNWYGDEVTPTVVGAQPRKSGIVEALNRGDIPALVDGLPIPPDQPRFSAIMARTCPQCADGPVYVEATAFTQTKKGVENKMLKRGFIDASLYREIRDAVAAADPPPEVVSE